MKTTNRHTALLLIVAALQKTIASSGSSNPSHHPDVTAFTFRADLSRSPEADSSMVSSSACESSDESEESSVVSSSLLYDGGCVVSAEAIMCTGGDDFMYKLDFDDEYEESESDDDDDDDDGHSSMLSNASLRRPKVGAGGFRHHSQQSSRYESSGKQGNPALYSQEPKQSSRKNHSGGLVAKWLSAPSFGVHRDPAATYSSAIRALSRRGGSLCVCREMTRDSACHFVLYSRERKNERQRMVQVEALLIEGR